MQIFTKKEEIAFMPSDNIVILVHGFTDNAGRMAYMSKYLRKRGKKVLTPTLKPSNGTAPMEELAAQLAIFIEANCEVGQPIDLVGFSMGGLICRYYLQRLGGLSRTSKFISISTPHNGTLMACFFNSPGVRQMRPSSLFLKDLDKDADTLKQIECTVFYTPLDLTILPASSSIVSFAQCSRFMAPIHFLMVYYKPLLKKTHQILNG